MNRKNTMTNLSQNPNPRSRLRISLACALAGLAAALSAPGCSSAPMQAPVERSDAMREYKAEKDALDSSRTISPGFLLKITHSNDSSITGEYRVSFKGELKLPYKVKVNAAGRTTEELSRDLVSAYSSFFKGRNNITVDIIARDYLIEVRGLVKKPGVYSVKVDTSIEELVSLAGGLASNAEGGGSGAPGGPGRPEYIRIVRMDYRKANSAPAIRWVRLTDYFLKYDIRNEVLWRGGEQLFFQVTGDQGAVRNQSQTFQLLGEIKNPGEYAIQNDASFFTYITRAGGQMTTADLANVTVIRRSTGEAHVYDINHASPSPELAPGDVVLVKAIDTRTGLLERLSPLFISIGSLTVSIILAISTL
jgi:protein involved in polysaccharide export with SLBB domain